MITDYLDARAYLRGVRLQFDKTMTQDMKDALEKADEALAIVHAESQNIMWIPPKINMEEQEKKNKQDSN